MNNNGMNEEEFEKFLMHYSKKYIINMDFTDQNYENFGLNDFKMC